MNAYYDASASPEASLGAGEARPASGRGRTLAIRRLVQFLGLLVCVFFAVQGVHVWLHMEPVDGAWEVHRAIGEVSLYLIAALSGCFLEARALLPEVAESRRQFALNRLLLGAGYLWAGFYSMGGYALEGDEIWNIIFRMTGTLAWVVCFGEVCIACCPCREDIPPPGDEENDADFAQSQDMGYCRNCGYGRGTWEKFCPMCGLRFVADGGPAASFAKDAPSDLPCEDTNPFAGEASALRALTSHQSPSDIQGDDDLAPECGDASNNPFDAPPQAPEGSGSVAGPCSAAPPAAAAPPLDPDANGARFLDPEVPGEPLEV